jgi:hypothetical protein
MSATEVRLARFRFKARAAAGVTVRLTAPKSHSPSHQFIMIVRSWRITEQRIPSVSTRIPMLDRMRVLEMTYSTDIPHMTVLFEPPPGDSGRFPGAGPVEPSVRREMTPASASRAAKVPATGTKGDKSPVDFPVRSAGTFMLPSRESAARVASRSAAGCPRTDGAGWQLRPFGMRCTGHG